MRTTLIFATLLLIGCANDAPSIQDPSLDPTRQAVIEEPDLYKLEGDTLYVQNRERGLHVIDVSDPRAPIALGYAPSVKGAGAEIFAQPGAIIAVMIKEAESQCARLPGVDARGWSADTSFAIVDALDPGAPRVVARHCLPGELVASRTVDRMLYVVVKNPTQGFSGSRAYSIDLAIPDAPRLVAEASFAGASKEILVTQKEMVVASSRGETGGTRILYLSIDAAGAMTERGTIDVPGQPQGRFHMDLSGTQFRIVTFRTSWSVLNIVDFANPDAPVKIGQLDNIGSNERLYATRFDGDLAYVVTFRRTDPLWVISLKDPTKPVIVGELQVPGWSDFLFPRGNRLVAVGRAADTRSLGLSLFDVSNPAQPRVIEQIDFNRNWNGGTSSEANLDYRGATILDRMPGGTSPVLVIPYAEVNWSYEDERRSCTVRNYLQIVDIEDDALVPRGQASLKGSIRRSFPVGDSLYALSDYELKALDVADRDAPIETAAVGVGTREGLTASTRETCDTHHGWYGYGCSTSGGGATSWGTLALVLLALAMVRRRRAVVVLAVLAIASSARAEDRSDDEVPSVENRLEKGDFAPPPALVPMPQWVPYSYPRYELVTKIERNYDLGVSGLAVFTAGYMIALLPGLAISGESSLAIPVAGPMVYLADFRKRFDCSSDDPETIYYCRSENAGDKMLYAALAFDFIAQAGGVAMAIAGFTTKHKVTRKKELWSATPWFRPSGGGVSVTGTF